MGLFHLITCDVLPEVYQYLISQVSPLESTMLMCILIPTNYSLCTFKRLHDTNHINAAKFRAFLWTNNKSHIDFDLLEQIMVEDN